MTPDPPTTLWIIAMAAVVWIICLLAIFVFADVVMRWLERLRD